MYNFSISDFFFLNIFNFTVLIPSKKWADKVQAEWNKTGYDSNWLGSAQQSINILDRAIEGYRYKYGTYPNSLSDIKEIRINNNKEILKKPTINIIPEESEDDSDEDDTK